MTMQYDSVQDVPEAQETLDDFYDSTHDFQFSSVPEQDSLPSLADLERYRALWNRPDLSMEELVRALSSESASPRRRIPRRRAVYRPLPPRSLPSVWRWGPPSPGSSPGGDMSDLLVALALDAMNRQPAVNGIPLSVMFDLFSQPASAPPVFSVSNYINRPQTV